MQIMQLTTETLEAAAGLFVENYRIQRQTVPVLPARMADPHRVIEHLNYFAEKRSGLVALEGGRPLGYLGWFIVDDFRDTGSRAAYAPEWAHATKTLGRTAIYRLLYRAAAERWSAEGCRIHAISLLATDAEARETWFWNGFGLTVVDAVRPIDFLNAYPPDGFQIRPAKSSDARVISELDLEHCAHYALAPVFMPPRTPGDAAAFEAFLQQPNNSVWLAYNGEQPVGLIQFAASGFGAADIVEAEDTIAVVGAYVQPQVRGRGLAAAILDAALQDYAGRGFTRCSVDFESFNPEAAAFWMKYFDPVCYSLTRVPENML